RGGVRKLPRRPALSPRARLGPRRGRRGDARHHLVRAALPRRARALRAPGRRRRARERHAVRGGRVGEGRLRPDRPALRRGGGGERARRRRARDRERGSLRGGLARPRAHERPLRARRAARRRGVPQAARRRGVRYSSLTREDRKRMLEVVGVSTVEELFRDIPEGVRLRRPLQLDPPLAEQEIVAHLEQLAARNVPVGSELSFLGAGVYDHYVPPVVDLVLGRGEFLTAYTPYQPGTSQGELTGMDVSNASGYDGTTVAADACYMAKHVTGRSRVVVSEATNPQVRQVVK